MSENWKIQVSVKLADYADPMVNLRAETGEELDSLLTFVTTRAGAISDAIGALRAAGVVAITIPTKEVTVEQSQPAQGWNVQASTPPPAWSPQQIQQAGMYQQPQQPQFQQPVQQPVQQQAYSTPVTQAPANPNAQPGPAPVCQHGPMKWIVDNKHSEPEWRGFFCSAQKNDPSKCKTQYVN